jgi:hypothetical protein
VRGNQSVSAATSAQKDGENAFNNSPLTESDRSLLEDDILQDHQDN